jgi:hypothetical protein
MQLRNAVCKPEFQTCYGTILSFVNHLSGRKNHFPKTLHQNKAVNLFSDIESDSLRVKNTTGSLNRLYHIERSHPG